MRANRPLGGVIRIYRRPPIGILIADRSWLGSRPVRIEGFGKRVGITFARISDLQTPRRNIRNVNHAPAGARKTGSQEGIVVWFLEKYRQTGPCWKAWRAPAKSGQRELQARIQIGFGV